MPSFSLSTCRQIPSSPNTQKLEQQQGQLTVAQQQGKTKPGSENFAAKWLFNPCASTQALQLGQARLLSRRDGWFAAAVVPGRPWPEATELAPSGKSNDLLLRQVDRNGGEAMLSFITRTSVIMEGYRKDAIYSEIHVCDSGTNRSPALSPSGSSLRTRVRCSTG